MSLVRKWGSVHPRSRARIKPDVCWMVVTHSNVSLTPSWWPEGSDARNLPVGPPVLFLDSPAAGSVVLHFNITGRKRTCKGGPEPGTWGHLLYLILGTNFLREAEKRAAVCKFGRTDRACLAKADSTPSWRPGEAVSTSQGAPGLQGGLGQKISKGQQFL